MKITEDDDFMYVNVLGNSIFVVMERRMVLITNEDLFRRFFKKKRESFFSHLVILFFSPWKDFPRLTLLTSSGDDNNTYSTMHADYRSFSKRSNELSWMSRNGDLSLTIPAALLKAAMIIQLLFFAVVSRHAWPSINGHNTSSTAFGWKNQKRVNAMRSRNLDYF